MRARARRASSQRQHGALADDVVKPHFKGAVCFKEFEKFAESIRRRSHSLNSLQSRWSAKCPQAPDRENRLFRRGLSSRHRRIVNPAARPDAEVAEKILEQCAKRGSAGMGEVRVSAPPTHLSATSLCLSAFPSIPNVKVIRQTSFPSRSSRFRRSPAGSRRPPARSDRRSAPLLRRRKDSGTSVRTMFGAMPPTGFALRSDKLGTPRRSQPRIEQSVKNGIIDQDRGEVTGFDSGLQGVARNVVNELFQLAVSDRAHGRSGHADRRYPRVELALE